MATAKTGGGQAGAPVESESDWFLRLIRYVYRAALDRREDAQEARKRVGPERMPAVAGAFFVFPANLWNAQVLDECVRLPDDMAVGGYDAQEEARAGVPAFLRPRHVYKGFDRIINIIECEARARHQDAVQFKRGANLFVNYPDYMVHLDRQQHLSAETIHQLTEMTDDKKIPRAYADGDGPDESERKAMEYAFKFVADLLDERKSGKVGGKGDAGKMNAKAGTGGKRRRRLSAMHVTEMDARERTVAHVIGEYVRQHQTAPGLEYLASELKCSTATIHRTKAWKLRGNAVKLGRLADGKQVDHLESDPPDTEL